MSHLRYIKKGGKTYGPYTYNSIRTNDGKVRNIYLGKPQNSPVKSVVQKTIFLCTIALVLFMVIFFLNNSKQPTGLVVVENGFGEQVGNYGVEQTEKGYDIQIYDSPDINGKQDLKVVIKEAKDLPSQVTTKIGLSDDNKIKTEIFAIKEELDFDKAVLRLKKTGNVNEILYCPNFDFNLFECDSWEETEIPFTDLGDSIEFTVTHFTAYAGGGTGDTDSALMIWDDTDSEGGPQLRYASGCLLPLTCSIWTQHSFFANYTNHTAWPINTSSSNCTISFNLNATDETPAWTPEENMSINETTGFYEYTRTFNNRGVFEFNTTCFDDYFEDNSTTDTFTIQNSNPYLPNQAIFELSTLYCFEDQLCYLNFSDNCTDPDEIDRDSLVYEMNSTQSYETISFNETTGEISIFATNESQLFNQSFPLSVSDNIGVSATTLRIEFNPVNDPPALSTPIPNQTLYEDADDYTLNLSRDYYSDEEGDLPYWWDNNTIGGVPQFINISYSPIPPDTFSNGEIINASPSNNEVGNYSLEIMVNDTANNSVSQIVIFEVVNVNDPPNITYYCNDNTSGIEGEEFACYLNATDDDIIWGDNLTFTANYSWVLIDYINTNDSQINFTITDATVGEWSVNITVTDSAGAVDSEVINITLYNIDEGPNLTMIGDLIAYTNITFYFEINATDSDLNITSMDRGDNLTFSFNETNPFFTLGSDETYYSGDLAFINFTNVTISDGDVGTYWLNFTVNDSTGALSSETINFTVYSNEPPSLIAPEENNVTEGVEFSLDISEYASDTEGNDTISSYTDNATFFDINLTGGITFTANDSFVGQHWVNITVADFHGAVSSQFLNFTINNVEDSPNFTEPIGNHTAYEDTEFYLVINATDEDFCIPVGNIFNISENLTFAVNDTSLFDVIKDDMVFDVNPDCTANATINFTAVNYSQAGLYWFEINVTDSTGLYYTEIINITIEEVNDAPQFTDFRNITDAQQGVLVYYDFNASDEENGTDATEGNFALTFWIANITNATDGDMTDGGISINITFFDDSSEVLNSATGVFTFTPTATHAGMGVGNKDYKINLSVNDSDGAMDSVIINLSIKNENDPPVLDCNQLTATNLSTLESITMYENDTNITFSLTGTGATDADGDVLTFNWTLDDVVNKTETSTGDSSSGVSSTFSYYPGFFDAREQPYNLTLLVSDGTSESVNCTDQTLCPDTHTCYKNITVLELNSPPEFILTIQNISWNQDTTYTNLDLDTHFSDIENQIELAFTYDQFDENLDSLANSSITVSVDNTTHVVTFTPNSSWYGLEYIQVHANDSTDNVSSNTFFLNVSQTTPATVTTTTTGGGGGGGGGGNVLVTIDIIHPGALTIYKENVITSPIIIRNSNDEITLRDISLTATTTQNLDVSLSETYIAQLNPGEEKEVELTIKGVSEGFEEILITAVVRDPEVTDTAKIFTTIVAVPKEIVEKIKFVKDLFKENPECLELNELITRAESDLAAKQYDAALEKVNSAIEKCKDLITTVYKPTDIEKKVNLKRVSLLILINLISVTFTIFIINKIIKRRRGTQWR